ncbi:TBC1 domain family member 22B-like isoform X2 [Lineus longissimus]|uniref:TBC1 domain family member 22B-like isoform X2 n=1 Tax=Lineus longissimus TaxID=88925 RepID=UPI002B4E5A56
MRYGQTGNTLVMSGFGGIQKDVGKPSFWKKNTKSVPGSIKPVYGAQHPPRHERPPNAIGSGPTTPKKEPLKATKRDSFQDFENKTNDAWDDGDDDLIMMANVKMSLKDVHSTAMAVINSHSQQQRLQEEEEGDVYELSNNGARSLTDHLRESPRANQGSPGGSSPHHFGPGVGVRLNYPRVPKPTQLSYGVSQVLQPDREKHRIEKMRAVMDHPNLDLDELKKVCWSGIPKACRPSAWKLLSGYLPASLERRQPTLERKRSEYFSFVEQYFDTRHQEVHASTFRQIHIDIPRMNPLVPLFQQKVAQEIFERILYIWAIRHPASGYVQGMNDLVTPFFVVFLSEFADCDIESDNCDLNQLPKDKLNIIEADCYWCLSKLLDGIQDNYTFAQPGIQLKVKALKELVKRINASLHDHLEDHQVEFLQFSFRWMNNLLMREIPLRCTIRLWDTYQSEAEGFASFHLYVCASFLVRFSHDLLRERDFQGLMLMLQNLPTHNWGDEEIGLLLAEAYKLKYMFADAPNHLSKST